MNRTFIASSVPNRAHRVKSLRVFVDRDRRCLIEAGSWIDLEIEPGTVKELNEKFIEILTPIQFASQKNIDIDEALSQKTLNDLRKWGSAGYISLGDKFVGEIGKYDMGGNCRNIYIQSSAAFPLLWEFLSHDNSHQDACTESFLGSHHQITRVLTGMTGDDYVIENPKKLLFCRHDGLKYWRDEFAGIQLHAGRNHIQTFLLDNIFEKGQEPDPGKDADSFSDTIINSWVSGQFDFIHLASHVVVPQEKILEAYICFTISNQKIIVPLLNLINAYHGERLMRSPLIFLNACKTMTNPDQLLKNESFPRRFLQLGAGGVIATAYDIPDLFAKEFSSKFYELFLQNNNGTSISASEALRQTREYFIIHHKNPLGLVYGLYAFSELNIIWDE
jgi:hypothetical protein